MTECYGEALAALIEAEFPGCRAEVRPGNYVIWIDGPPVSAVLDYLRGHGYTGGGPGRQDVTTTAIAGGPDQGPGMSRWLIGKDLSVAQVVISMLRHHDRDELADTLLCGRWIDACWRESPTLAEEAAVVLVRDDLDGLASGGPWFVMNSVELAVESFGGWDSLRAVAANVVADS